MGVIIKCSQSVGRAEKQTVRCIPEKSRRGFFAWACPLFGLWSCVIDGSICDTFYSVCQHTCRYAWMIYELSESYFQNRTELLQKTGNGRDVSSPSPSTCKRVNASLTKNISMKKTSATKFGCMCVTVELNFYNQTEMKKSWKAELYKTLACPEPMWEKKNTTLSILNKDKKKRLQDGSPNTVSVVLSLICRVITPLLPLLWPLLPGMLILFPYRFLFPADRKWLESTDTQTAGSRQEVISLQHLQPGNRTAPAGWWMNRQRTFAEAHIQMCA